MAGNGSKDTKAEPAQKRCFVIGPIGGAGTPTRTHADWLLEGIIQPAFIENFPDYKIERSDIITEPGMIDSQIINLLIDADLVIADMSHLNANAFYEMGIRHMAQKPIIHMFLAGSEIPFDVKPYRAIPFSVSHPRDLLAARSQLVVTVRDAISEDHKIDNPVSRAIGQAKFEQSATPSEKILSEELRGLREKVVLLERSFGSKQFNTNSNTHSIDTDGDISQSYIIRFMKTVSRNREKREEVIRDLTNDLLTDCALVEVKQAGDDFTFTLESMNGKNIDKSAIEASFALHPHVESYREISN